jgi:hypothetical protein
MNTVLIAQEGKEAKLILHKVNAVPSVSQTGESCVNA